MASLIPANLEHANLSDVDLRETALSAANLSYANLIGAHVGDVLLSQAAGLDTVQANGSILVKKACWSALREKWRCAKL